MVDRELTSKAELLLLDLQLHGGGALPEFDILKRTGLSHGSFSAARKELVAKGLLALSKSGRQTVYTLTAGAEDKPLPSPAASAPALSTGAAVPQAPAPSAKPSDKDSSAPADGAPSTPAGGSMPHVTGEFFSLDEWEEQLTASIGGCLDISQSLTDEEEYSVYSHDFETEDIYQVSMVDGVYYVR